MAPKRDAERRPLLSDASASSPETHEVPAETPDVPDARRQRVLYVAVIGLLINSIIMVTAEFTSAAMNQLVEGAACQKIYPEITDPYHDTRCKDEGVQTELSFVVGWDASIGVLPGLITAIPYGIFAEKYGPRALLILGFWGGLFNQLVVLGVCLNPSLIDIRWIWTANLFSFIGGGEVAFEAMRWSIANAISTKSNRATVFLYLEAMSTLFTVVLGPFVYAALERGPVLTECIGAASIGVAAIVALALPRDIGMVEPSQADEEREEEEQKTNIFVRPFVQLKNILTVMKDLVKQNKYLGLFLFSLIFTTIGELEGQIRKQYAAKRYEWAWSTVSLVNSTTSIVSVLVMLVAVPAISQYLLKRNTALGKDIWLARLGILSLAVGCFGVGAAPSGPLFVAALSIYRVEICYDPAIMSIIAAVAGIDGENEKHASLVYMSISFIRSVGIIISGPLLAECFRLGLRLGGGWLGLPFFMATILQLIVAIILFTIRDKPKSAAATQ